MVGLGTGSAADAPGEPYAPAAPGYEILGELGRGGMGVVYKARDVKLNRVVALKMVLAGAHADPRELVRFLAEAEAVAAVEHPHVVRVFGFGEHDGRPYMALEFCDGGTLGGLIRGRGRLAPADAAAVVGQVARGVQAAHDLGIVHRDLKPANVLLASPGREPGEDVTPKVTDFGLARRGAGSGLTQTNAVMGTPAYMAPEQARGQTKFVGPAADVWALGVILYECLAGRPPFEADDTIALIMKVVEEDPPPLARFAPGVPLDLELICRKCLTKEPHGRYSTAAAFADDLGRWLAGEAVSVRPLGTTRVVARWLRRHLRVACLTLAAGLVCALMYNLPVVLLAAQLGLYGKPDPVRSPADRELYGDAPRLAALTSRAPGTDPSPGMIAVWVGVGLLAATGYLGLGLLVVRLARPPDLGGAVSLGVAAGLVGAVVSLVTGIGPWVVCHRLQLSLVGPSQSARHPREVPAEVRVLRSDALGRLTPALWWGFGASLVIGLVPAVGQAAAAHVLRGRGGWRRTVAYLEMTAPWSLLVVMQPFSWVMYDLHADWVMYDMSGDFGPEGRARAERMVAIDASTFVLVITFVGTALAAGRRAWRVAAGALVGGSAVALGIRPDLLSPSQPYWGYALKQVYLTSMFVSLAVLATAGVVRGWRWWARWGSYLGWLTASAASVALPALLISSRDDGERVGLFLFLGSATVMAAASCLIAWLLGRVVARTPIAPPPPDRIPEVAHRETADQGQ
jgi:tRNA A-37 threonylcarbamoyl transferase component Bud32